MLVPKDGILSKLKVIQGKLKQKDFLERCKIHLSSPKSDSQKLQNSNIVVK